MNTVSANIWCYKCEKAQSVTSDDKHGLICPECKEDLSNQKPNKQ